MAKTDKAEATPAEAPKAKRGRPRKAETDVEEKPKVKKRGRNSWTSLMKKVEDEEIVEYDINGDFAEKEAIRHKKFGVGVITKILDDRKIEVVFEEDKKVLAQNWD